MKDCPELTCSGWINLVGPSEWGALANKWSTQDLEWLIRVLVTAERELKWVGGSVAASIWLYRLYQERADGDADKLADWMLRNSGNKYVPFGSLTAAHSLVQWHDEQLQKARRCAAYVERQANEQAERNLERQTRAWRRQNDAQARKQALAIFIEHFERMSPVERLTFIAERELSAS